MVTALLLLTSNFLWNGSESKEMEFEVSSTRIHVKSPFPLAKKLEILSLETTHPKTSQLTTRENTIPFDPTYTFLILFEPLEETSTDGLYDINNLNRALNRDR
ncbi:hypothetical protein Tco_1113714 [Tanacetum coccineum]|uniref:Uncharacterized protein n=1 Tax=Tanacetum coccineum TaxID=301880 RepID=A0ABQ5ITI4_9ASTR